MNSLPTKTNFVNIAQHLTEGIASGRFPVGTLLPTEMELCNHYTTSRHTVRAALHELQQLGLVSRKKNVGTRVESTRPTNDFRPSLASVDDLVQFGSTHVRKLQEIVSEKMEDDLATDLRCKAGSTWLRISSLRMDGANDRLPVGWTDVYIEPAYAEIGEIVRHSPGVLISTLIETRYGRRIEQIQQEIRAVTISEPIAQSLQVDAGSTALKIIRWYYDAAGDLFEVSVSIHPAERFSVSMLLKRS
ncbi:GntR family transcriptional regulator [Undibacterium sp. CY18W]|uniref:GntR family transcriptional regulator n=1 Tax=Undibacterium hunanense TaxID=2762292 RepID=A0ABR6ZKY3_9BURK|nr:GntR family transcriptional regulator [Undibacterium hunanense]MBC3916214.1 GntR family transcriptional regulator [Undibacterium hunanense]